MKNQGARWALTVAGGAAVYIGVAQIGFALDLVNGAVSTVWVPTGASLAFLFLGGRNLWPALVLGEFLANWLHGSSPGTSLVFGAGDAVEALVGCLILTRLHFRPQLDRLRDVFTLLLPAAFVPTLLGATIGTASLLIGQNAPWSSAWTTWHTWWLGDATGMIIAAPLIFAFASNGLALPRGRSYVELVAFAAALIPLAWVAGGHTPEVALAALPVLAWGALRFGQRGAALANAIVAGAGVALVDHGGTLSGVPLINRLLLAQDFLLVSSITTLVLAAVMSEREQAEADLRASEQAARALGEEQRALGGLATAIARETPTPQLFELAAGELKTLSDAQAVTVDTVGRFVQLLGLAVANAEARQVLINRAATDPLTGLANHRTFTERLREEMARCRRHGRPLAVAMIDIDHFKLVNDSYGHRAGDTLLGAIAEQIVEVSRAGAVVARLGGDEFALILPESDAAAAHTAVERARSAVSGLRVGDGFTVSLSAGVCDSEQADTPEELMERADAALYEAKAAGRNRSAVFAS